MKDLKGIFRNLEKKLRQSGWFDDDWQIYNRGVYLQLYKGNWHNERQGGVHFETFVEGPQLKEKEFPVCFHAEDDCPSQQFFIHNLLAMEEERIKSWKGYKSIGEGYSVCQRTLPLNFKNLENRILEEFNRLRQVEAAIDHVLRTL